jgi:hypothetical protein
MGNIIIVRAFYIGTLVVDCFSIGSLREAWFLIVKIVKLRYLRRSLLFFLQSFCGLLVTTRSACV